MSVQVTPFSQKFNSIFPQRILKLNQDFIDAARKYAPADDEDGAKLWKKLHNLLKSGADVNAADENGNTALLLLCERGWRLSAIENLIEAGADVNKANVAGETPLMNATRGPWFGVRPGTLQVLLDKGADPKAVSAGGRDALEGLLNEVRRQQCTQKGQSREDELANMERHRECVKQLTSRGVTPTEEQMHDIWNKMPWLSSAVPALDRMKRLDDAVSKGDAKSVRELLAQGASPNMAAGFNDIEAPLVAAAQSGNLPVIDALLEGGADIHQRSLRSFSRPVEAAARAGQKEAFTHLLKKGADPTLMGRDGDGLTLLEWMGDCKVPGMKEFVAVQLQEWNQSPPEVALTKPTQALRVLQLKPNVKV